MADETILDLPVAIGLDGSEWFEIVQAGTSKRAQGSEFSGIITGFVPTSRQITTTEGLRGGGALTADLSLTLSVDDLLPKTAMDVADAFAINDVAGGNTPKKTTFPNAMKALAGLTALAVPNLTNDYLIINRAADGLTYKVNVTALGLATGQVPAGGTTGQALVKQSATNYDSAWSTAAYPATAAAGTILAAGALNTIAGTSTPTLGVAGSLLGTLRLAGNTSGSALITPQAVAGAPTLTLPNASGTFVVSASAPLTVNATTGNLTVTTGALTKTDDTNVTLTLGGTPTTALLVATSLTLGWTGTLALARGGTGANLTAQNGGVVYSTSTGLAILAPTSTAGQHLQSAALAPPSWTTATFPATAAAGTILAAGTANVVSATATPTLGVSGTTAGQLTLAGLTSGSGVIKVAAAAGAGIIFQLPSSNGSNTNVLTTNGAGVTSWTAAGGAGDVVGPASAISGSIVTFNGPTGKLVQDSGIGATASGLTRSGAGVSIEGTNTNNNAAAGYFGEFISAAVLAGSAVVLANNTPANLASINLGAGDWDVWGQIAYTPGAATSITALIGSINTVTAASASAGNPNLGFFSYRCPAQVPGAGGHSYAINTCRISVSVATDIYLNTNALFTASTLAAYGFIAARRAR